MNGCSLTAYSCAPDARYPLQQPELCLSPPPPPARRHLQPKSRPPLREERERERERHTDNEREKVKALAASPINPSGFESYGAGVCPAFPSGLSRKGTLTPRLRLKLFARFHASCSCVKTRDLRSGVAARARKLSFPWIPPTEATGVENQTPPSWIYSTETGTKVLSSRYVEAFVELRRGGQVLG